MFVSHTFAIIYILPNNFIDFSNSIFYSLGFSSNFYFLNSDQTYAVEPRLLKSLLHTWSLSVKEQFYILFPKFLPPIWADMTSTFIIASK